MSGHCDDSCGSDYGFEAGDTGSAVFALAGGKDDDHA